jgi:hypothetical protein
VAHFPLLPLGPVLWSDAMANVADLEAMVPLLPDCLLVLNLPEPQAAALVAEGAITDAVWMSGGHGLLGETAARALMDSREGKLTAYRIDDARMSAVLRTLLGDPATLVVTDGEVEAPAAAEGPAAAPDLEPTTPADRPEGGGETIEAEATPTFDLDSAYVGAPDGENGTTAGAVDPPAPRPESRARAETSAWWSSRPAVTPLPAHPRVDSTFGPVGAIRSPLQVAVRVLATLGVYALSWQRRGNLELEAFDPDLPARKARSITSSVLAWLLALLITVAGAVLFASTRQSIHLPLGRQLTSTEAYYLIGGLACLYLIVILPFNLAAATANLCRIRLVQHHVGISARGRAPLGSARLMVIPVIGRLVLLGLEQRAINSIWNAARIADAPVDVVVDTAPTVAGEQDTAISGATEAAAESVLSAAPEAADRVVEAAGADVTATENSDEVAAIFSEMQSQPEWMRIAAPKPEDAAPSEAPAIADGEVNAGTTVTDKVDAPALEPIAAAEPELSVATAEPDESASVDSTPRSDPVWFNIPTPPADEVAEPAEADTVADATEPQPDFVAPRLDIDIDGLRDGLNQIAVKWLGADDVAPVAAAIAAARPGVDDFVAAIAAIRAMDIPGRESPIVRAMAREMHYYATEVLCAA